MCDDWEEDGVGGRGLNNGAEVEDDDFESIPDVARDAASDLGSTRSDCSVTPSVESGPAQNNWKIPFGNHRDSVTKLESSVDNDDTDTLVSSGWNFTSEVYAGRDTSISDEEYVVRGMRGSVRGLKRAVENVGSKNSSGGFGLKSFVSKSGTPKVNPTVFNETNNDDCEWEESSPIIQATLAAASPKSAVREWVEKIPITSTPKVQAAVVKATRDDADWEDDVAQVKPAPKATAAYDEEWEEEIPVVKATPPQPKPSKGTSDEFEDDYGLGKGRWKKDDSKATRNKDDRKAINGNNNKTSKTDDWDDWDTPAPTSSPVTVDSTEKKNFNQQDRRPFRNSNNRDRGGNFKNNNNYDRNRRSDSGRNYSKPSRGDPPIISDDNWDEGIGSSTKGLSDTNSVSTARPSRGGYSGDRGGNRGRGPGNNGGRRSENGSRGGGNHSSRNGRTSAGSTSGFMSDTDGSEHPSTRTAKSYHHAVVLPEGDELFAERDEYYDGVGDNFDDLEEVAVNASENYNLQPCKTFEEMELPDVVLGNVKRLLYAKPTPIQQYGSSVLMANQDLMASSQNGTGKTAGFLLPILKGILSDPLLRQKSGYNKSVPACLILSPTRELAIQIAKEAHMYSKGTEIRTICVYGGTCVLDMGTRLKDGCNILVATPGRLLQASLEGYVDLSRVKYFVLDEADRMLDLGFMPVVEKLVTALPSKEDRVSAMFSATFPDEILKIASSFLKEYVFVVVGILNGATADVTQEFIEVPQAEKIDRILDLLKNKYAQEKAIVFCASRVGTDFLAMRLCKEGVSSTAIHGGRYQFQREEALREFMTGKRRVLVATSVAARGLDIPKVSLVINYDLPDDIEDYVHRIGRTGRIGHTGISVSFYDHNRDGRLAKYLATTLKLADQVVPEFLQTEEEADAELGEEEVDREVPVDDTVDDDDGLGWD